VSFSGPVQILIFVDYCFLALAFCAQGEKKVLGRNVLFVRAFFLATKANNLAAIEF